MRGAVLALFAAATSLPAQAGSVTFDQTAPIAPYGVPVDAAQAKHDSAALSGADPQAPLPALPPPPAPPPPFRDKTPTPR